MPGLIAVLVIILAFGFPIIDHLKRKREEEKERKELRLKRKIRRLINAQKKF